MELFPAAGKKNDQSTPPPLADRMRPRNFDELVGQEDVVGPGAPLRKLIEQDKIPSLIFWGPPGSGKTTIARIIASLTCYDFVSYSAVTSGVKEIRQVVQRAQLNRQRGSKGTILFIDEIHRFNKAQQDAFLPHVESGLIVLIGATTENPSFEVISALLSRCRVFILHPLTPKQIDLIIQRALTDRERGLRKLNARLEDEARNFIINIAGGDARVALNLLEIAVETAPRNNQGQPHVTLAHVMNSAQRKMLLYDKSGEEHYNLISAFHKSLRGSDPDAALYWLARMLEGGEDPLYLARRMIRFASEDVGNADPQALQVAVAAKEAVEFVGMPECELALAQAAIYLATAPKSNSTYLAYQKAKEDVHKLPNEPVPLHLRNPVTKLMREAGYGKNYHYPHSAPEKIVADEYLPQSLKGKQYYIPGPYGFEKEIKKRLDYWNFLRQQLRAPKSTEQL